MNNKRILVVDGSTLSALDMEKRLRALGLATAGHALSGEAALASVAGQPIDAVLVSPYLPGTLSLDVLLELLQSYFHIPVVVRVPPGETRRYDGLLTLREPIADVLLQQRLEEALNEQQWPPAPVSDFCRIFSDMQEPVLLIKPSGELIYANAAAERLCECRLKAIAGHEVDEALPLLDEHGQSLRSRLLDDVDTQGEGRWLPGSLQLDDRRVQITGMIQPLRLEGDQRVLVLRLRRREATDTATFAAPAVDELLDLLPFGIALVDRERELREVNKPLLTMLGYERTELLGHRLDRLLADGQEAATIHDLCSRATGQAQLLLAHPSGTPRRVQVQGRSLSQNGTEHAATLLIITTADDHDRVSRMLLENERMAAVGAMAGGLLHEFNNALAVLVGYVELLQRDAGLPPKQQERLGEMDAKIQHMTQILRRLLAVAPQSRPSPTELGLHLVVNDALKQVCDRCARQGVDLTLDLETIAIVRGDRKSLAEALTQVLNNALDVVEDQPRKAIDIRIGVESGDACLRVSDNGCGFGSRSDLSRLLLPFVSGKGAHAREASPLERQQGTGLGLSIANSIVRNHGGYITLERGEPTGAVVSFYLPLSVRD